MSTSTRIFVIVGMIAGGAYLAYWLQRNDPSESRRVRHPQGYSICCPRDWSAEVNYAKGETLANARRLDGLLLMPDNFDGIPPKLFINRYENAPDPQALRADGWTDGLFQGEFAFVREKKPTKALVRTALFQRAGQWFELVELLSVPGSVQKEEWWRFMETFRYPDGELPTTKPAHLAPAGAPASSEPFQFPAAQ